MSHGPHQKFVDIIVDNLTGRFEIHRTKKASGKLSRWGTTNANTEYKNHFYGIYTDCYNNRQTGVRSHVMVSVSSYPRTRHITGGTYHECLVVSVLLVAWIVLRRSNNKRVRTMYDDRGSYQKPLVESDLPSLVLHDQSTKEMEHSKQTVRQVHTNHNQTRPQAQSRFLLLVLFFFTHMNKYDITRLTVFHDSTKGIFNVASSWGMWTTVIA